jgi:hypothetical protein
MCGLLGFLNKSPGVDKEYRDWFENMLIVDTLRGWDGTGIAAFPKKGGTTFIYKKPIPGWDFIQTHVWDNIRNNYFDYDMIIGHNRLATHGKQIEKHTHPFSEDNVVLVHNGVITNHYKFANAPVDSQAIAISLSKADNCKEVLEAIDGSFAFVWFDYRDQLLRFARNNTRPLWLAFDERSNGIMWASERWMLEGIANRVGLKLSKVEEIPAFTILEFNYASETLGIPNAIPFKEYQLPKPQLPQYQAPANYNISNNGTLPLGILRGDMVLFYISAINSHKGGKYVTVDGDPVNKEWMFTVKSYNANPELFEKFNLEEDYHKIFCGIVERGNSYYKKGQVEENIVVEFVREANDKDIAEVNAVLKERAMSKSIYVRGPDYAYIPLEEYSALVADGCSMCATKLYRHDADSLHWTSDEKPICSSCVKEWRIKSTV